MPTLVNVSENAKKPLYAVLIGAWNCRPEILVDMFVQPHMSQFEHPLKESLVLLYRCLLMHLKAILWRWTHRPRWMSLPGTMKIVVESCPGPQSSLCDSIKLGSVTIWSVLSASAIIWVSLVNVLYCLGQHRSCHCRVISLMYASSWMV